eukprot:12886911-Prorocentrum_lima.AAC.1
MLFLSGCMRLHNTGFIVVTGLLQLQLFLKAGLLRLQLLFNWPASIAVAPQTPLYAAHRSIVMKLG